MPPAGHTVTATASCSPTSVNPGGTTACSATGVDSQGHTGLAWSWSDGGAGGTFSPSASVQNPSYTAPLSRGGPTITLMVSAIDEWQWPWVTGTVSASLTVTSNDPIRPHRDRLALAARLHPSPRAAPSLRRRPPATAPATPSPAGPGPTAGRAAYFSPSATVQNPTYTAPANTSGSTLTVTLTVTAQTADGTHGSASRQLLVNSASGHTVTATAAADPTTVASGGPCLADRPPASTARATAGSDGVGPTTARAAPSLLRPRSRIPTYNAPPNTSGHDVIVTLTVSALCEWQWPWIVGTASVPVDGHQQHGLLAHGDRLAHPSRPPSLPALPQPDRLGHRQRGPAIVSWLWSDGGAGGTFIPSAAMAAPTYYAPVNTPAPAARSPSRSP